MDPTKIYTLENPLFTSLLTYGSLLTFKMFCVQGVSVAHRIRLKFFGKKEITTGAVTRSKKNVNVEPPQADEMLQLSQRAHMNDLENIVPFISLSFLYLSFQPSYAMTVFLFRLFTVSRVANTICFFTGQNEFRSMTFLINYVINLSLGVTIMIHSFST